MCFTKFTLAYCEFYNMHSLIFNYYGNIDFQIHDSHRRITVCAFNYNGRPFTIIIYFSIINK